MTTNVVPKIIEQPRVCVEMKDFSVMAKNLEKRNATMNKFELFTAWFNGRNGMVLTTEIFI